jgi:hypothetical protein
VSRMITCRALGRAQEAMLAVVDADAALDKEAATVSSYPSAITCKDDLRLRCGVTLVALRRRRSAQKEHETPVQADATAMTS